ncbi:MAG: DUF1365 domain-containing protein [Magnetospiraceae bacterium]
MKAGIYIGRVTHHRHRPVRHDLGYRVFSFLLDLDRLETLARDCHLFSHNRFNLFSFHDKDHGAGDGAPLRDWVDRQLLKAGVDTGDGPVFLLCYPRMLGYVFNPLSVYYCYDRGGALQALLYEVHNTHGERHTYVLPVNPLEGAISQACDKRFFVSPFIGMTASYRFVIHPPADRIALAIHESDPDGPLLDAVFHGRRRAFSDRVLARLLVSHPLMTLKVILGIHWEAFRLWRKGLALYRHRAQDPSRVTTIVPAPPKEASETSWKEAS